MAAHDEWLFRAALAHEGALLACLYRYSQDSFETRDLLHETYIRLLKAGSKYRPPMKNVRAFALKAARNVALDWLRHKNVLHIDLSDAIDLDAVEDESPSVERSVIATQERDLLAAFVERLPARCKDIFELRVKRDLTFGEIAKALGIAELTARTHMKNTVRRIVDLELHGEEESSRPLEQRVADTQQK
jgi:RNA polymerase sigma-70 factor (ECF subfamily)